MAMRKLKPARLEEPVLILSGTLPLPPGINQSYKVVKVKVRVDKPYPHYEYRYRIGPTEELEQFKVDAQVALRTTPWYRYASFLQALQELGRKKVALRVEIVFYYPTLWLHDIDGGVKHVIDAVFDHHKVNDNMITRLTVEKTTDRANPRCEIFVYWL